MTTAERMRTHWVRLCAVLAMTVLATGCSFSVGTDTAEDDAREESAEEESRDDDGRGDDDDRDEETEPTEDRDTDDPAGDATDEDAPQRPEVTIPDPGPDPAPPPTPTATPAPAPAAQTGGGTDFTAEVPMSGAPAGGEVPYASYVQVTDDTGRISLEVPAEWSDVDGAPVQESGITISDVRASSDLAAFASTWTTPGVAVSAADLPGTTPAQVLDGELGTFGSQCTFEQRLPYSDPLYVGEFDIYRNCGGTGVTYVVVAAQLPDGSGPIIEVQIQVVSDRDLDALEHIVDSFVVV